jgi:hypothetical protein
MDPDPGDTTTYGSYRSGFATLVRTATLGNFYNIRPVKLEGLTRPAARYPKEIGRQKDTVYRKNLPKYLFGRETAAITASSNAA